MTILTRRRLSVFALDKNARYINAFLEVDRPTLHIRVHQDFKPRFSE